MTKPATDFAEEDLAMARRALWLLEWPSRMAEQPPAHLDLMRLSNFRGKHGSLLPLAHFARIREDDASRAGRLGATPRPRPKEEGGHGHEGSQRHTKMREKVCVAQKKANELMREAELLVRDALEQWRGSLEDLAEIHGGVPPELLTGEPGANLVAPLDTELKATLARMDQAMRWPLEGNPFPSLLGLPKTERNASLNSQALRLHEAGHSLEQVAYVMGWDAGTRRQVRDRMSKRLEVVRVREAVPTEHGT